MNLFKQLLGLTVISASYLIVLSDAHATQVSTVSEQRMAMITNANGGAFQVGDSLIGNYANTFIDNNSLLSIQWYRNDMAIEGAINPAYTLLISDSGQMISFKLSVPPESDSERIDTFISNRIIVDNSAPIANNVIIEDKLLAAAQIGDVLNGTYIYADIDIDLEGISTYSWLRNGIVINGANSSTYTLVKEDIGQVIHFEVTPVAATGTLKGEAVRSKRIIEIKSQPTSEGSDLVDDSVYDGRIVEMLTGNYIFTDTVTGFE